MFVPRQIQKKAAPFKILTPAPAPAPASASNTTPKLLTSPPPSGTLLNKTETNTKLCVNDEIDPVTARETVMALEMLLSDFSMGRVYGDWLRERMRAVDGKDDFIHLSTFVDCQFLAKLKPSQVSFMKALSVCESGILELSTDKYYLRRKSKLSSSGIGNSDDYTIYIEPHTTNMTLNPGKVARIISQLRLPQKYLPVQFVEGREKAWGFVVLSSEISQTDAENKELWPKDWIVMTKSEWRRRDTEYKELRRGARRAPAPYNQVWPHESVRQEKKVHCQPEMVGPRVRAPAGPQPTANWDGASSHAREADGSGFEPGLIVRLTKLDPTTTKATINLFVCHSVDRYLRGKARKQEKGKDGKDDMADIKSVKINYVDYEKGLSEAYTRQSSWEDSKLIVNALGKRKRNMRDGEDTKGKKVTKSDGKGWVDGKVLTGEEEWIYWQKLLLAKNMKGKGKGKKGLMDEKLATPDFIPDTKRTRKASITQVSKRIKFNE